MDRGKESGYKKWVQHANMPTCQHANMPTGPNDERRVADTNANGVNIAKIAIGEIEDTKASTKRAKSGRAGAAAHAKTLTVAQRSEITKKAADSRWS